MTTEEGNRLIALFIGFKEQGIGIIYPFTDRVFDEALYVPDMTMSCSEGRYEARRITQRHSLSELKFHRSWDWLMPVVLKIESLGYNVHSKKVSAEIFDSYYNKSLMKSGRCESKILALWKVCVDFVIMYNELNRILT